MTLRGELDAFPLETVIQLIASTSKTGQLEVRGDDHAGTLGFDRGRLVSATAQDDAGETALGAVFAVQSGSFEFIPWNEAPASNLSGALDQLLDLAVVERDRIIAIRGVIPDDRSRFRLSERAADRGEVTLSAAQWRTLLAVNGDRDVVAVAAHLKVGRFAALGSLAGLIESGFVDVVEPPAAPAEPTTGASAAPDPQTPQAWSAPAREPQQWSTPAPLESWERPATAPEPERRAPATPAEPGQWSPPEPDLRADLAAALDARMSPIQTPEPEAVPEPSPVDLAPAQDERLAALTGVFGPAQPVAPAAPPPDRIADWSRPASAPTPAVEAARAQADERAQVNEWTAPAAPSQPEGKKSGLFGFLRRDDPAVGEAAHPSGGTTTVESRAGSLAAFSNALLAEYNSGQYGKGRIDDRMANLLMRVDEQADPIDRPLPVVDDRIDVQALEREGVPEQQALPYLAMLVSQVYGDAERAFGKDKAKRGYRAAQQQVFGGDLSTVHAPDIAGRLPKV
ncbi:MAG TPA: DUF4388 domain-containing protein [Candidatus Limnocylindria bacterium]|nr:DUF4388 domain-containing protein [Candidatus Limnocylindria bacterium]